MSGDSGEQRAVKPLTKRTRGGEPYRRREEVESQLREVLALPASEVFSRLHVPNRKSERYLYDETLVYLAREAVLKDDRDSLDLLYREINRRCWLLLRKFRGRFPTQQDLEDLGQEVQMVLVEKIFDKSSDRGDYAQVNLGDFLVKEFKSKLRGYYTRTNREAHFVELDAPREDGPQPEVPARDLSPEEQEILRNALAALPEKIREAAVLYYLEGWQIESRDENEPTVSKKCGVSSRTIRNWLRRATENPPSKTVQNNEKRA